MATRSRKEAIPERQRVSSAGGSNNAMARKRVLDRRGLTWLKQLWGTGGAQLLELALALPFLAVLAVGVSDFGGAYNLRHILTNAAREAARITASNPLSDSSCTTTTPCSIEAAADAVKQYLTNAGLSKASCISPTSPNSSGTLTWTYSCSNITLTINRGLVLSGGASGTVIPSVQVTLTYPYTWTFGQVIGLLNGSITLPSTLTTTVVMEIIVSG